MSYSYLSPLSFSSVPSAASVQSPSGSPSPPPPPPPYSSSSRAATRSSRPSSAKSATGPPLSPPPAPLSFPPSPCHGRAGGWLPAGGVRSGRRVAGSTDRGRVGVAPYSRCPRSSRPPRKAISFSKSSKMAYKIPTATNSSMATMH